MSELAVLRRQTRQYINYNPSSVTLVRSNKVDDGAGGKLEQDPAPLPAQTVRVIQASENEGVERRNRDGEVVRPSLNMLAEWDANVQVGDTFSWDGKIVEVVYITKQSTDGEPYEQTCEVAVR